MKRKFRPQSLLLALVFALISFSSTGQIPDLVQTDGIVNPLHKANIGWIRFMNGNIPLDQLIETDINIKAHTHEMFSYPYLFLFINHR